MSLFSKIFGKKQPEPAWKSKWEDNDRCISGRVDKFEILEKDLGKAPASILDIGCGLAIEAGLFQQKHDTELYLLDGDFEQNSKSQDRDVGFGEVDNMQFYLPVSYLKSKWDERGMKYHFLDANNLHIEEDVCFDVIWSFKSCGFHYPLSAYSDLIRSHSSPDTRLIFDIRADSELDPSFNATVISKLIEWEKGFTAEIRLN